MFNKTFLGSKSLILAVVSLFLVIQLNAQNPFGKFAGNWKLKDGKWEWSDYGTYGFDVDSTRYSNAELVPKGGLIWHYNLSGGNIGQIFWSYNDNEKKVYWLSQNAKYASARGETETFTPGDSISFKVYFEGIAGYRKYIFKLISEKELFLRAYFYENDKPTGSFYGATWIKE
jgi:hypothetical protein